MMEPKIGQIPNRRSNGSERGFTVLEMTMAAMLFAVVLGAILSLLEVGRKTRLNTLERGEDTQDVRIALNQMSTDVLNAGVNFPNVGPLLPTNWLFNHVALPASSPVGSQDNLTPVIPGASVIPLNFTGSGSPPNSTLTCSQCSPTTTTTTDQVTLVSVNYLVNCDQSLTMGGTNAASLTSQTASMPVTAPTPTPNTGNQPIPGCSPNPGPLFNPGDIVFLWSEVNPTGTIGMITSLTTTNSSNDTLNFAGTDPLGLNSFSKTTGNVNVGTLVTGAAGGPIGAYKLDFVTYYVKDDGSGRGTGTLMRRVYGGTTASPGYTDEPLAFDVVNMSISYVLANSPEGVSSTTTTTNNPTLAQYQSIRQIIVKITVQTPSAVQVTNQAKYDGVSATPTPTVNPYVQETLTAVMNTRNLGYEKN
ncbi:MAG TPA: PilW family protein [Blastocatellia bacterium]